MKVFAVFEAKNRFSELIALVESGQEIAISRRGRAVARIVSALPSDANSKRAEIAEVFGQLRRLRTGVELDGDLKILAREGLD